MRRALLAILLLLVAGCAERDSGPGPALPTEVDVGPPPHEAGGFADCASQSAILVAAPLRATATDDAEGHPPGIHRLDNDTILWVWATYEHTQRQDRITRLNEVQLFREPNGSHALCTRVELAAPTTTDGQTRTYDVAAHLETDTAWPHTPMHVTVNWIAGCQCAPIPRGNTTAQLDPPNLVPKTA